MTGKRYPRSLRLLTPADFKRVMDGAVFKASQGSFLLLARPSESGNSRIGFIIAKKKVRLAVDRNRIKRCVRDDFRLMNSELPAMDIVFLARQDLSVIDNTTLHDNCRDALRKLARKARQQPSQESPPQPS